MKTHIVKLTISFLFIFITNGNVFAQGEGSMTKENFDFYGCHISSMTVKWSFNTIVGEPEVNGTFKWTTNSNDYEVMNYAQIQLKCQSNTSTSWYAWVPIAPVVPKPGKGYGMNVAGSPDWDKLFCGYNRYGEETSCWSAESAKAFWKAGFRIVDFTVVPENKPSYDLIMDKINSKSQNGNQSNSTNQVNSNNKHIATEEIWENQEQDEVNKQKGIEGSKQKAAEELREKQKQKEIEEQERRNKISEDSQKAHNEINSTVLDLITNSQFSSKSYNNLSWGFGINIGIPFGLVPLITNTPSSSLNNSYSTTDEAFIYGLSLGCEIWPIRGPNFGIEGFGSYNLGIPFNGQSIGSSSIYNYGGKLIGGLKKIKGVLEYSEIYSNIEYNYQLNEDFSPTTGTAKYKTLRKGFGIMFDNSDDDNEKSLTLMCLFDHPDFLPRNNKSIIVWQIFWRLPFLDLSIEYANHYPIGGKRIYSWQNDDNRNKDYFFFTLSKTISFGDNY